ncbi:putative calcium-binding protein CML46 [Nicotiana tabacum]|uniref:Calcium-binding protein CML46 n=1 Tax=Nicotiana tabacum TaxID=4097 RepID=A0A1S4CVZ8_TOBAC|nr:probable calcium-binding protein CML46 [Nicotiana tomentosiformis]XP_016505283.1 PREDICTED: probable calcium-binding protein CML45 [Nicotiana tabacum]
MDRLMIFKNSSIDATQDELDLDEVLHLFAETEPSLEEVKEAFDHMFDWNGDGYIDAQELEKVICRVGVSEFSVEDCKKKIMAFDKNGDGRIELREFVKLVDNGGKMD